MDATELPNDIRSWSGWLLKAEEDAIMEGHDQRKKLPRFAREDVARILAKGRVKAASNCRGRPASG
jgi:hypothetical protein